MSSQPNATPTAPPTTDSSSSSSSAATTQKRKIKPYHRIKAHCNPLSDFTDPYPLSPDHVGWEKHYPAYAKPEGGVGKPVEFADVGCGYGGLLVTLSPMFPETLIIGMEIRNIVVQYVDDRIKTLREKEPGKYNNISVVRTNAMKYLPNFFKKGQLKKVFFLFPDPHFKKSNHKRRIISPTLLAEYAYTLTVGGLAYTITDVEELHIWMVKHFKAHPLFEPVSSEEMANDPVVQAITHGTEEGRKVAKIDGKKFPAVFRRIAGPYGV